MCVLKDDPLYAFAFLNTFLDILRDYFGEISAVSLKENFDIVYQLLEETLDAGGHPLTTAPNALRDIVLPPSLFSKLLNAAGMADLANGAHSSRGMGAFASPIPWRKAGVRYNTNDIYFDITETLKAVVNKFVHPVSCHNIAPNTSFLDTVRLLAAA
jgi:AP-3 complex subunit mu